MAVTKNDMVLKIAKEIRMHQTEVKRIVQMTLDGIIQILATSGRLELRNFGVFEAKTRKRRKARNPRTGQEVFVEEHKSVTFKAGKFMTDRINGRAADKEAGADD
jgi:nucleoid DNA-binding protein